MHILEVKNISKKYHSTNTQALNGISLHIAKGEFVSIVGESGSGKTTLLRIIKGLEDTDEGDVWFDGKRVWGPASSLVPGQEGVELVHQDFNLLPKHSVYDNVTYGIRYMTEDEQRFRADELLDFFHLRGMEQKRPGELSGGQQQRVALAKALAAEPELLLMDEPFTHLDLVLRNEIRDELKDYIKKFKTAVLFVTHEGTDALSLSDRIVILKEGRLIQEGEPSQIYQKPVNEYVAHYFGNANILRKKDLELLGIQKSSDKACLRNEDIQLVDDVRAQYRAKVVRSSYYGPAWKVELRVNDKVRLKCYSNRPNLKKGDEVGVWINKDKIHAF